MVLGHHFPEEKRLESVRHQLTPWRIIRLFCEFTSPHKEKFLVVLRVRTDTHVLVVNSEVAPAIRARPALAQCQVTLDAATHPALRRDSILNCGEVCTVTTYEAARQLVTDMSRIDGEIPAAVRTLVIEKIEASKTIPRDVKALVLDELRGSENTNLTAPA